MRARSFGKSQLTSDDAPLLIGHGLLQHSFQDRHVKDALDGGEVLREVLLWHFEVLQEFLIAGSSLNTPHLREVDAAVNWPPCHEPCRGGFLAERRW